MRCSAVHDGWLLPRSTPVWPLIRCFQLSSWDKPSPQLSLARGTLMLCISLVSTFLWFSLLPLPPAGHIRGAPTGGGSVLLSGAQLEGSAGSEHQRCVGHCHAGKTPAVRRLQWLCSRSDSSQSRLPHILSLNGHGRWTRRE